MASIMGIYGITNKINVAFSLPYVKTHATDGVWHDQNGLQDFSFFVKWNVFSKKTDNGKFTTFAAAGVSFPVSNYEPDYLPLSIGLHSKNIYLRGIADYRFGKLFATGSATWVYRSNITVDRTAYYTTQMHLTEEVDMPDAASFNVRFGYYYGGILLEAVADNWTTLGGFDITRNNMPFPGNRMNATRAGIDFKYELNAVPGLAIAGGGNYVIAGRNMGQSLTVEGGVLYTFDFSSKKSTVKQSKK